MMHAGVSSWVRLSLVMTLGTLLLWGCGSSGGERSSDGGNNGEGGSSPTLNFQPDSMSSTSNLLSLSLNKTESTKDLAVFDIIGTSLDTAKVAGIAADLSFDAAYLSFAGFEADTGGADVGLAAPLEGDSSTVVLGFHALKTGTGRLGKVKFQVNESGRSGKLSFANLTFVDPSSSLLVTPAVTGQGGTLQN